MSERKSAERQFLRGKEHQENAAAVKNPPSETIFPHPRALNSAATTPPIRFPIISFLLLTNTAALSSKRMYRPSGLRVGYLVRTTTA